MITPTDEHYRRKYYPTNLEDKGIPDDLTDIPYDKVERPFGIDPSHDHGVDKFVDEAPTTQTVPTSAAGSADTAADVVDVINEAARVIATAQEFMRIAVERLDELKLRLPRTD